jgi:hypothetical protein
VKVDKAEHQRHLRRRALIIQHRWKTGGMHPSDGRGSLARRWEEEGRHKPDQTKRLPHYWHPSETADVKALYSLVSSDGCKLD